MCFDSWLILTEWLQSTIAIYIAQVQGGRSMMLFFGAYFLGIILDQFSVNSFPRNEIRGLSREIFRNHIYATLLPAFVRSVHKGCTVNHSSIHIHSRCLMVSTDQADSRGFYFRISWILMEWRWFYFFRPLHLLQGLRSNNIK